jgi:hypothetical protein
VEFAVAVEALDLYEEFQDECGREKLNPSMARRGENPGCKAY